MQRIVIKSIITKPTKKEGSDITTIEDEKGAKMSKFNDTALAQLHAGDTIDAEIAVEGKYLNITSWKLIESKPEPVRTEAPQSKPSGPAPYLAELDGRFRNTALMQACELSKAAYERIKSEGRIISIEEVLAVADKMYAWLKGDKTTPHKETVQPAKQEAPLPIVATASHIGNVTENEADMITGISKLLDDVHWKPPTWRSWIKLQFPKTDNTGTLSEVLSRLDPNQTNMLRNHLTELRELK